MNDRFASGNWMLGESLQRPPVILERVTTADFEQGDRTRRIHIGSREISPTSEDLEARIVTAYAAVERPLCICRCPRVPMYVARFADRHLLKRMPDTGKRRWKENGFERDFPNGHTMSREAAFVADYDNYLVDLSVLSIDRNISERGSGRARCS